METERQKARDCHYERIGIIHKLQDETKDMHDKEMESLKQRMARVGAGWRVGSCRTASFFFCRTRDDFPLLFWGSPSS